MKYTDVAWDFDGTLVDTYPCLIRIYQDMLEEYGYRVSREEIHSKISISFGHAHKYYSELYGISLDDLRRRYRELRALNGLCLDEMKVYPGVAEVLKAIKESGRRNHLYTNRNRLALSYLEAYGLLQYFDGFVTSENIGKLKPEPDGLYVLLEAYHISPERLLMVGDRAVDMDAAKAAGADTCFYNTNGIEVPANADHVVEDLMEILTFL